MNYNSSGKYNSNLNYNSAAICIIKFVPIREHYNYNEDIQIQFIGIVSSQDSFKGFFDERNLEFSAVDFAVGTISGEDNSADWFNPLNMKVDWANTMIQVMPSSESEYIDISTIDGSFLKNTIYKNRSFSFILYSHDGLSDTEKDDLKQKIVKLLDLTKESFKKLYMPPSEHFFYVKYSGSASVQTGPSYVKATIPFEVKPYSYPLFPEIVIGEGEITNNGLKDSGLIFEISGSVSSPSFNVALSTGESYSVKWSGSVSESETLIINGENMTCYKKTSSGSTSNAITSLSYQTAFIKLPKKKSAKISGLSFDSSKITTRVNESYIW